MAIGAAKFREQAVCNSFYPCPSNRFGMNIQIAMIGIGIRYDALFQFIGLKILKSGSILIKSAILAVQVLSLFVSMSFPLIADIFLPFYRIIDFAE
jgi:hypothetical protein